MWSAALTHLVSLRLRLCVPPWCPVLDTLWEGGPMAREKVTQQSSVMLPGTQGLWEGS